MAEQGQTTAGSAYQPYSSMTDIQFKNNLAQLQSTVAGVSGYASPTPQPAHSKAYMKNLQTWSSTATPPPKSYTSNARSTRARAGRASNLSGAPTTAASAAAYTTPPVYQQPPVPVQPILPPAPPNPPRPPLPTTPQALQSTYAPRLRTGVSLLVQPTFASTSTTTTRTSARRGGVVNYADPGSGDDLPDAGAIDSDDSDFVASGGTRTSIRQGRSRLGVGMSVFNPATGVASTPGRPSTPRIDRLDKTEIGQSYLGMVPPSRLIKSRPIGPTPHEYPSPDVIEKQAQRRTALVPIRVEFETDTLRIRDCFVWNINETVVTPENFARIFCNDLDLPLVPWADTVANQIRAQLEEHEGVASMEIGLDGASDLDTVPPIGEEIQECRVILSIDVQIANYHLMDHIEWDLLSPLTPEAFAQTLCMEVGLSGEAIPLVAHAIYEELTKHKKDAIEWGVIGGDLSMGDEANPSAGGGEKAKGGWGVVKDKTGLGLNWGRAPKDGRGPKTLKSVWRDWAEAEEFRTKFEELTAEEVERREIERERASRRLRRETSKFQTTRNRRR